jgi:molybdate/tungstate transport system permease protein
MLSHKVMPTLLVIFAVLPFVYIISPLLHMFGSVSPGSVLQIFSNQEVFQSLMTSVLAACITTLLALIFGLPTAFLLSLRSFPGKRILEAILLLPMLLPPVVGGIGQLDLYGPYTGMGGFLGAHGIALTNSLWGVVLAQTYITSPFMILAAQAGFEEVPRELHEATRVLGGGMWSIFWRVSIPLTRAAIGAGVLLTFARAIGEFGATMIMAYHPYTIPVELWVQFTSGGMGEIVPIAVVIVLFALLVAIVSSFGRRKV